LPGYGQSKAISNKVTFGTRIYQVRWRNAHDPVFPFPLLLISICNSRLHSFSLLSHPTVFASFLFTLMYMQYKSIATSLDPASVDDSFQGDSRDDVYGEENPKNIFNWQKARHYIINQKLYLQAGITVNKLSELFHTNRTSFSSAVNKNEGQNFSMFINQLRMVEAKKILTENPEKTLTEIAQHCGYTEQSNFTRQFRQLCGDTPAVWKEKNKKRSDDKTNF
jgi:AraC-like DNA-binding protein